jgi:hypothetical protein
MPVGRREGEEGGSRWEGRDCFGLVWKGMCVEGCNKLALREMGGRIVSLKHHCVGVP